MVDIEDMQLGPTLPGDREFWIEITDSQQKFDPNPTDLEFPDPDRVTFEVHSWSKPLTPASLNFQLLPILEDRGVPRDELARLLVEDMTFQTAQQKASLEDAVAFRKWNNDMNSMVDDRVSNEGVRTLGSVPESSSEKINWLLDVRTLFLFQCFLFR